MFWLVVQGPLWTLLVFVLGAQHAVLIRGSLIRGSLSHFVSVRILVVFCLLFVQWPPIAISMFVFLIFEGLSGPAQCSGSWFKGLSRPSQCSGFFYFILFFVFNLASNGRRLCWW